MPRTRAPITHYMKSIVAFVAPLLTNLAVQLQTLRDGGAVDWASFGYDVAIYFVIALVVWATPNADA